MASSHALRPPSMLEDVPSRIEIAVMLGSISFNAPLFESDMGPSPAHPLMKYADRLDTDVPWCVFVIRDPQLEEKSEILLLPDHEAEAEHGLADEKWWTMVKKHIRENQNCFYVVMYGQAKRNVFAHSGTQIVTHVDANGEIKEIKTIA